jgi:hypothetical protein
METILNIYFKLTMTEQNLTKECSGCIRKSPPDTRDFKYGDYISPTNTNPPTLDLRPFLLVPRTQYGRPLCAAFSGSCMKEYQERKDCNFNSYMSPEFIYWFRDDKNQDGMYLRNVMQVLQKNGCAPNFDYPFCQNVQNVTTPSSSVLTEALNYKISNYAAIGTIDELKTALNTNGVCIIAFPVYKNRPEFWRSLEPPGSEPTNVGHAVSIVGYNEQGFILRNSWGKDWNGDGCVIYPYSDWGAHWEIWSSVDIKGSVLPQPETIEQKIKEELDEKCNCKCILI